MRKNIAASKIGETKNDGKEQDNQKELKEYSKIKTVTWCS